MLIDTGGESIKSIRSLHIPRTVDLLRIPARGEAPLPEILAAIHALPARDAMPESRNPFLEIAVALEAPEPTLQQQVQDALADRAARLVRLSRLVTGTSLPLAESLKGRALEDLSPDQVFLERHRRQFSEPPGEELMAAFEELWTASREGRT
jgi:exonuclease SbcD